MLLFLVRHGEAISNKEKFLAGQTDAKLTELGIEQALSIRDVMQQIPFDKVFSSDLSRAYDTQKCALPDYEAELTPLLRETDLGTWTGRSVDELHAQIARGEFNSFADYGGENKQMLLERARKFLDLMEQQDCERIAAFSHKGFILTILECVMGVPLDHAQLVCDNCAIHVLHFNGKQWSLFAWNYMRPLSDFAGQSEKQALML